MSTGTASILLDLAFKDGRLYATKQIIVSDANTMYVEFASEQGTDGHIAFMNGLVHIHKDYEPRPRTPDPKVIIKKIGGPLTFEYSDRPKLDKVMLTALLPKGYTINRAKPMPNQAKEFARRIAIHYEIFTAAEWRLEELKDTSEAALTAAVDRLNRRAPRRTATEVAGGVDGKQTVYDRWLAHLKNRPIVAAILLLAAIVAGMASLTDSLGKLGNFFHLNASNTVEAQETWWDPRDPERPVASVIARTSRTATAIPWAALKREIETEVLPQVTRVPKNSSVELRDDEGQVNKFIVVLDSEKRDIAHVWVGFDPKKRWAADGLVRVGIPAPWPGEPKSDAEPKVWNTFERYSDGSYRRR